jgi:ribosomal protein S20
MKDNTTELTDTTININIRTGVMHRNKAEEAHTRNDFTSYYIGAINYFIRVALDAQSLLDMQTDSQAFRNDVQFRENLQFMVQLSEAFSEWMPDYSNGIADGNAAAQDVSRVNSAYKDATVAPEVLDLSDESEDSQQLNKLAAAISEVLQNPLLPIPIYNAILHGTDDIINSSNSADNAKYETSPEHIKAVLKILKV